MAIIDFSPPPKAASGPPSLRTLAGFVVLISGTGVQTAKTDGGSDAYFVKARREDMPEDTLTDYRAPKHVAVHCATGIKEHGPDTVLRVRVVANGKRGCQIFAPNDKAPNGAVSE